MSIEQLEQNILIKSYKEQFSLQNEDTCKCVTETTNGKIVIIKVNEFYFL